MCVLGVFFVQALQQGVYLTDEAAAVCVYVCVCVIVQALERGVSLTDEAAAARVASTLQASDLPAPGTPAAVSLRSETVGNAASQVSVLPSVRVAVNRFPHTYVEQLPSQGTLHAV